MVVKRGMIQGSSPPEVKKTVIREVRYTMYGENLEQTLKLLSC